VNFTTVNWLTAKTITVTAQDDALAEGNQAELIAHNASGGDYAGIAIDDAAVWVVDDDGAGIPNLVARWKFDLQDVPGPGQSPDEVGANHADYDGMTFLTLGMQGTAIQNDGTEGRQVEVKDTAGDLTLGSADFTITFWAWFDAQRNLNDSGEMVLIEKFNGVAGPGWTFFTTDAGDDSRNIMFWENSAGISFGSIPFVAHKSYHFALVRSGINLTLYIDGALHHIVQDLPAADHDLVDGPYDLVMGNRDQDATGPIPSQINGGIDEVRLYNTALGQAAIQTIMAEDYEGVCGMPGTEYRTEDLNQDCVVGFPDLAIFLQRWLNCTDPALPAECDTPF
jgi:hypothetical protein